MTDVSLTAGRGVTTREPGKIQLGVVWQRSLRTFGRAPVTFIALVLLPLIVSVIQIGLRLMTVFASGQPDLKAQPSTGLVIAGLVLTILQYVVQIVSQGATIHIAARLLAGDRFTWSNAIGVGFRRFFPLIGAAILVTLSIFVGFLLLIVPGIILSLVLVLAVPACIVERLGPIQSMKRSAFLTRSNRWRILAAFLVMIVLPLVTAAAIAIGAAFFLSKLAVGILAVTLMILLLPCLGAISLIMLTVLLVELRALKEGGAAPRSVSQVFE